MSTKSKHNKNFKAKDAKDNRKFLIIVALSTLVLMILMYFIFVR